MNKRARGRHDDPLSAASAGLVALGIDRAKRVDVLDVLGSLIDHADATGHAVLDRPLFAREERLGVDKCLEAYALLEQLEVVHRTERGWTIRNYEAHNGPTGETEASLAVLRRHLNSVGHEAVAAEIAETALELAPAAVAVEETPVVHLSRWRKAVPIAAGLAASAAVVAGVTQFVPQAAVSSRNAALTADAPTIGRPAGTSVTAASAAASGVTGTIQAPVPTSGLAAMSTTDAPAPGVACLAPNVVTAVTSVTVVQLPFAGERGAPLWGAVVNGTATLQASEVASLLPALQVVVHLADGDTDPVVATVATPLLSPGAAAPFNAVVALGSVEPRQAVTATASAAEFRTC